MRKACTIILLMFSIVNTFAQSGNIEGMVKNKDTNTPLSGANIFLSSSNKGDITNSFGKFTIEDLAPGHYNLIITSIGYKNIAFPVEIKNNQTCHVEANMEVSALDLAAVVVTGKKISQLNTVAAIDIKLRPVNTSQDILRIVPGLFIAQHAGGGKADQLFLRGYDVDHGTDIAETVDGIPVNMVSHAHGQGYADLHFLIPELVEKVNFDKGPYNIRKGNLATAGWIDFSTKDFLRTNTVKLEYGQYDYKRAVGLFKILDQKNEQRRKQFYIGTEYFKNSSYFDNPQDFHRYNIFGKYTVIHHFSQFQVWASAFDSKWNASGQIPERAVLNGWISRFGSIDNTEGGHTSRINCNAQWNSNLKNNFNATNQFYFSNYQFNLFSNFTFFLKDSVNGDEINQKEKRNIVGYNGLLSKKFSSNSSSELGYGFRQDFVRNSELNHVVHRKFLNAIEQGDVNEFNAFAYVHQNFDLTNNFTINTGFRFDHFQFAYKNKLLPGSSFQSQSKNIFSPKLNLNYTLSQKIKLLFSTGIGFHSNDARVILNRQSKNILPKVSGNDLSFLLKPSKAILLKTTFWYLYSQQEFVYVGDEGIVEPSGRTKRRGIDFSGRYQAFSWLFLDIDLNYAHPRYVDAKKGNDYVPLAPVFTSIGGITIKTNKGFSAALRYRHMSQRPANESNTVKAQGYFITDALANYVFKKVELAVSAENIFDVDWKEAQFDTESRLQNEPSPVSEIHFTPGTPRFIKLGIAYNF